MGYFTPDLSGSLLAYKVTNDPFTLFQQGQPIEFKNSPIFADTLEVSLLSAPDVLLINGVDWEITSDDIDYTAMSRMKNEDAAFNRQLIKSITIIRSIAEPQNVLMSYQRLYPVTFQSDIGNDGSVELSPQLILEMQGEINSLKSMIAGGITGIATPGTITPKLLPVDIHRENAGNIITGEVQSVDVFSGISVIRPAQGSFFADSVSVRREGTDTDLIKGTDYQIFGLNVAKTKATNDTGGIYDFILISYEYAGNIEVTYHAVGGDVTVADMTVVVSELNNISEYLGQKAFLTPQSLAATPDLQNLNNRLELMEARVRILSQSGNPNYGDSTNGAVVKRTVNAVDVQHHWYNIAKLYKVDGSDDIYTTDRARFRIRLVGAKLMADVEVGVDLTLTRNPFVVTTANVVQDLGYTLFGDASANPVTMPQFRVIYNDAGSLTSGVYLQMGMALPSLSDVIAIEDTSGIESAWLLLINSDDVANPQSPNDDTVTLPDGASIWDSVNADSKALVTTMPTPHAYRAWDGAMAITTFDTGGTDTELSNLLPGAFRIEDVQALELIFTETVTGEIFRVQAPLSGDTNDLRTGQAVLFNGARGSVLNVKLTRDGTGLHLLVGERKIIGTGSDTFDLNYVLVRV